MPTPTPDTLFQGDHKGTPNPADPNLYSLGDLAAAMGTDSLAVSVATSKVTSTAASGALDSVPVSTASSKATSAAAQASVADSKAVSTSAPTSVADSKAVSVSRNTSVADSKAVSLDNALIIPAVGSLPGFLQPSTGATIRTANDKMAETLTPRDYGASIGGLVDARAAIVLADAQGPFTMTAGTYRVASNLTITNAMQFRTGAILKPDSGVTITINGAFTAPVAQAFNISAGGSVRFARGAAAVVWPEWFGVDGVNDAPAIDAAIQSIFLVGGTIGFAGVYRTTGPIIVTCDAGEAKYGLTFQNFGRQANNLVTTTPTIYAAHNGHAFDIAGAADLIFNGISIHGDVLTRPQTAWFSARNSAGSSCGRHRFVNCRTQGYFSKAAFFMYGSEENVYENCFVTNQAANAAGMVCTGYNNIPQFGTLTSSAITIATGAQSNIQHDVRGGSWQAADGTADVFYLDTATSFHIDATWIWSSTLSAKGRSYVTVDGLNATTDYLTIERLHGENGPFLPDYAIRVVNGVRTHAMWKIAQNTVNVTAGTGTFFYGDDGQTFDALEIEQVAGAPVNGVNIYSLQNSSIRGQNLLIAIRNIDSRNVLIGNSSNLTVGGSVTGGVRLDTLLGGSIRKNSQGGAAIAGVATLVAGTKTVATTAVSANSYLKLQRVTAGGAIGDLTFTKIAGTSFTITSASATDTSSVFWELTELF